jgi:hypothetical protein
MVPSPFPFYSTRQRNCLYEDTLQLVRVIPCLTDAKMAGGDEACGIAADK